VVAAATALCAVAWLFIDVQFNYEGDLTGLFYTGSNAALPQELNTHTYRVKDQTGYDGAYYHLTAHDPLLRRGFSNYADNPRLRWRRIGLPGLAALVTAGSDDYVDGAYVALQLVFVFFGAYWLGRYAETLQARAAWGLAFLVIPAVAVSLDRMTIDLPLAALTIALIFCDVRGTAGWPVFLVLCAAPLVRETGMVLLVGWCAAAFIRRNWSAGALGLLCSLPALAWWLYVAGRTPVDATPWLASYPFSGIIDRTLHSAPTITSSPWLRAAAIFEWTALAGIWLALFLALYTAWKRRIELLEGIAIAFTVFAGALGKYDIWGSAYATGRTMSPLLIALGLIALRDRRFVFALPLLLVVPRIALQFEAQLRLALKGG
jgi:hypothetical protein